MISIASWGCEVVRLCGKAGIKLDEHVRKQIRVTKEDVENLRKKYMEKKELSEYAEDDELDGNGYKAFALKEDWTPEDDLLSGDEDQYGLAGDRLWYRWDWKLEVRVSLTISPLLEIFTKCRLQYKPFTKEHPGGRHYDLTKMKTREKESYTLGTAAFSHRIGID